ncbi:hypothetical protein [Actinomyces minihominis]|uniref:hypothetical protein n=1 Tax=Actinomyces minihominis TaxID=2002838 RepID=UPI000C07D292|nr:hypothetical protein [Actinomyces minihominis]
MRRFTDPLLFGLLFIVTALTWLLASATSNIPDVPVGYFAPMTVVVFCIIATPALALVALMALVRALLNVQPVKFWAWVTGTSILAVVLGSLATLITDLQQVQVGFSTTAWFSGVIAVAGLIALVLSFTGAVPSVKSEEIAGASQDLILPEVSAEVSEITEEPLPPGTL